MARKKGKKNKTDEVFIPKQKLFEGYMPNGKSLKNHTNIDKRREKAKLKNK